MKRPHGGTSDRTLLDFSANVNPLGPPDSICAILHQGVDLVSRYPAIDAREFCEAAARYHGIPQECILAGNGSTDLIYLVTRSFAGVQMRVRVPAFTEYEDACEAFGIPVNTGDESVTFLANPTSPEGRLFSRHDILSFSKNLVIDEAFMDFVVEDQSLLQVATRDPRLIVIRTLTKFYAIPGLRLGFLVSVPETICRLKRLQPPWTVNALAAAAGVVALQDRAYADFSRRFVAERRRELHRGFENLGLDPADSAANFILCRVLDADLLCRELLHRGIAARNCDSFSGLEKNRYVRFAVRKRSENERLLATLKEILNLCPA